MANDLSPGFIVDALAVLNFVLCLGLIYGFTSLAIRRTRKRWLNTAGCLVSIYVLGTYLHLFYRGYMLGVEFTRIAFTLVLSLLLAAVIDELYIR